ncbi:helix-turn-helix domain-containing protein [Tropicibacter alexandrii]|uniref:helix-turn-helix domain-containing protein n=1 Tax=Tropicibacter alexandrii TaxID=2267683 RepID=UPI000EF54678|nr:helix-turn-helix transcriptional regulator [Tropicibacter alexandrii]
MEVLDSALVQTFANNLKRLRKKARISQEELALRSGLDRTYISGCERGVRNPSIISIEKIADALNVPAKDFFEGE